jgi:GNAT superfamily N-acetyltransferase
MDASNTVDTELPVQKQLDAYNTRDIDAFMRWWSEDCQYYEFPNRLLARGTAEIRERHVARFKEPNLHGRLLKRITVANVVIDHETVTRNFPDGPGEVDVIAIYEVENGKIAKAWFKMGPPRLHPATAFSLRPATADDAGAIRSLTRDAYSKWVQVIGREPLPMTADYDEAVRQHRIDLLHLDGKLAALIEMIPKDGHLLIENVAVSPTCQNRGLGRKLLAHAEQVAAAQGYSVIKLFTNKLFAANVQLYSKVGYSVDREEESGLGITVYMSKRVEAKG